MRSRGLFHLGIALLSQAGWVASADQRLVQNGIPTAPAFEEETQPGSASRYSWRNRNIEAKLDTAGGISFRFPDRRELGITFTGAKPGVKPQGEAASYPVSYYLAEARYWRSAIRWERVRYREIYPGIDLVLLTNAGQLEFNLEIRPEADPTKIRIRYHGGAVRLNPNGDLVIRMGRKQIRQRRAFAFQGAFNGGGVENRSVKCSYSVTQSDVTLRLGRYDPRRALTIDPVLNFSTYLGGPGYDAINALTADSTGSIYATGATASSSLLPGAVQSVRASREVWVAKLNSSGTQLLYLVYIGGSGNDSGQGIAIDTLGNAYVTGMTGSSDFPTTSGAFSTESAGPQEAFIAQFGPAGQLQYSTLLGGGADSGFAIAVDSSGAVYVAGQTASGAFPVTAGTVQSSNHGGFSDCFVSKLNAAGTALLYSTYLGGNALDLCTGIAIDGAGDAYVTGTTFSTNFPIFMALQSDLMGTANAFVSEINPAGSALLYSTYLGGSVVDNGNAIALDPTGAAYIAGSTSSPDFPTLAGAAQTVLGGVYNAFVSKVAPAGLGLTYSTLLGGSGSDSATAIAVDASGQAVAGGFTTSPNFPVSNAIQPALQGMRNAFATVLGANGSSLVFSSYFGGTGDDRAFAVAALPGYSLALGGMTDSANFPTTAALQSSIGGTYDGFLLSAQYQGVQSSGLAFFPLTPCRIADTRAGSGFPTGFGPPSLVGGATRSFPIPLSACEVPATAQSYSLNITVVPPGVFGFLRAWPTGTAAPAVSTVNSPNGAIVANAAIVSAGTNGAINLFANDNTDVILDINGYFAPTAPQALAFYPVTPCRVADTRSGSGVMGNFGPPSLVGGATRDFAIPMSGCEIPGLAQAYSVRMTVIPPGPMGHLTTWPAGLPLPLLSTLNALQGVVVGNEAIVPAGASGAISVFVTNNTDLVIDINGYFAPPGSPGALYYFPMTPCRVADTRAGSGFSGAFGTPSLVGGATRDIPMLTSSCSISPLAQAYSLNMTVVPPPGPMGFLTAWPAGQTLPVASTVNSPTGAVVASAAIVAAGTIGDIDVFASRATDLVIDINGYFAP